jgi:hypothetical protein
VRGTYNNTHYTISSSYHALGTVNDLNFERVS